MISNPIINQIIDYILAHIEDDISLDEITKVSGYSKYYLLHMFKSQTGEGIYEFIKRLKLEQSAFRLKVEKDKSITEIGEEYGYSASNYSSAFKQHHNTTPVKFRKDIMNKTFSHPFFHMEAELIESFEECSKKISIAHLPDYFVIFERRKGNYHDLGMDWSSFIEKTKKYFSEDSVYIERTFDDPSITNPDECLYDICLSVDKNLNLPNENTCVIPGGKFAIYHFEGSPKQIYGAYQSMFTIWLPKSGCQIDERYSYDIYRKVDCDQNFMIIDICIPVK
jgi:AraC family transcriptional regulator